MGRSFSTDGIRGVVNISLDCAMVFRAGQAAATLLRQDGKKPRVAVGMDPRVSSAMLENALTAGLCSCGADVLKLGVLPTPGAAYLTKALEADAGVMITASHEPYLYNGLRFFSDKGFAWPREQDEALEALLGSGKEFRPVTQGQIGSVTDAGDEVDVYLRHLASTVGSLGGLRIAVDCANGAASQAAHGLLERYALDISWLSDVPDGTNINENCGCTNLWSLAATVRSGGYDLGIAFDGDGDRCLVVDEKGRYVDGDLILSVCALELARRERLKGLGFVATYASNIGLQKFAESHGLALFRAPAGEQAVVEMMEQQGVALGGEPSGSIVFLEHMPTADGLLTALQLLDILCSTGKKVSELAGAVTRYPQVLMNVPGPADNAEKRRFLDSDGLMSAVEEVERLLGGDGRVLVRASASEPVFRVLVEAPTGAQAEELARNLAETIERLTKKGSS